MKQYILLFSILLTHQYGLANEINEFNTNSDGWTLYPSTMGRGSESGWVNVTNDREGSLRNNPTGTRYTYYWKLTRDFDLTNLDNPNLELKYHFKGHNYDYFRVQIGDEEAKHLSDFTVIHETTEATAIPEELSVDLSEYVGHRIRIQMVLRKPYDVVEQRIGLYIHRIAIVTPPQIDTLEEVPDELRIAAFNVQVFGRSKMDNPEVVQALKSIINRFDLIMIQEIRDISETAIYELLSFINEANLSPYDLYLSERLGRSIAKEQVAFLYRTDKLRFVVGEVVADPMDQFERPPIWTEFEYIHNQASIKILGAHLDPDNIPTEIEALYNEFALYHATAAEDESVLVMGNFNAGCRYLNQDELINTTLFNTDNLHSLIGADMDTTTTASYCPYDRLLVGGSAMEAITGSGVYLYDQIFGLTGPITRTVSDHYPVWAKLNMSILDGEEDEDEDEMMEMNP